MPSEEQYAAVAIEGTLGGLAALDGIGSAPTVQALEDVPALELVSALPRVGRLSEGVQVAPVTHAIGLDLDVIYLVGLSEDLFPGRLRDDCLLPERVRVLADGQLPSTRERIEVRHRSLVGGVRIGEPCGGELPERRPAAANESPPPAGDSPCGFV